MSENKDPETSKLLSEAAKELEKNKKKTVDETKTLPPSEQNIPADKNTPLKSFLSVVFVSFFLLAAFVFAFLAKKYLQTGSF